MLGELHPQPLEKLSEDVLCMALRKLLNILTLSFSWAELD